MKASVLACTLLSAGAAVAQSTGKLGDAAVTTNNPIGVSYQAILPESTTSNIRGQITGTTNDNGTGVMWNINFYGFPDASIGPFLYHLHVEPVPASGNCTATLAHLDPFIRGEDTPCDPAQPQTCQTGDLSGKFGNIPGTGTFQASYLDLYSSTEEGLGSFFGNRSVVIHAANKTRLTCASFQKVSGASSVPVNGTTGSNETSSTPSGVAGSTGSGSSSASTPTSRGGSGSGSSSTGISPPISSSTGAAMQNFVSTAAVIAGFMAFAL